MFLQKFYPYFSCSIKIEKLGMLVDGFAGGVSVSEVTIISTIVKVTVESKNAIFCECVKQEEQW